MTRRVYVIVMEAVYDHGSGGVFTTREAAEAHARAMFEDSDGHHGYRVEEFEVDVPVWLESRGSGRTRRHIYDDQDPVKFVPWSKIQGES